jgi:hypothetical protein
MGLHKKLPLFSPRFSIRFISTNRTDERRHSFWLVQWQTGAKSDKGIGGCAELRPINSPQKMPSAKKD